MRWERFYQSPTLIILGITILLAVSAIAYLIIPVMDEAAWAPSERARPLSELETEGRRIYGREGCWYCHTQQVRPVKADANLGPVSLPGDYVYQKPAFLGSERQGPDLSWVGDRLPDPEYHIVHLKNPRSTMPGSIMPSFSHLPEEDLRALAAFLVSLNSGSQPKKDLQEKQRHAHDYPPPRWRKTNPLSPSRETIAQGKRTYESLCARCHGLTGRGTGYLEALDFTDGHFMGEASDTYLFWKISDGVENVPGHRWRQRLREKERWQVVHYLRTFVEGNATE